MLNFLFVGEQAGFTLDWIKEEYLYNILSLKMSRIPKEISEIN